MALIVPLTVGSLLLSVASTKPTGSSCTVSEMQSVDTGRRSSAESASSLMPVKELWLPRAL